MFYLFPIKEVAVLFFILSLTAMNCFGQTDGWQSASPPEQPQLEEPKQITQNQTANRLPNSKVPSRHYVQGYPTAPVSSPLLPNNLFSSLFPAYQPSVQAEQQRQQQLKQHQQEQLRRRQEQLRQQQALNQQQFRVQQQAQLQQQAQIQRQNQAQRQAQIRQQVQQNQAVQAVATFPVQANRQQIQPVNGYAANSYQRHSVPAGSYPRNIGTPTWYDPIGLLIHTLDPKQSQLSREKSVQKRVADSNILNARDHEDVVAAAISNASKRFNVNQAEYTQVSKSISVNSAQTRNVSEIRQVSHDSVRSPVVDVSPVTTAATSSDLHKPWNLDEFKSKQTSMNNPYRQVSDVQTESNRTPPPRSSLANMLSPSSSQQDKTIRAKAAPTKERTPIFSLGKHLTNEFRPSNDRNWSQNHAVLQTAEFNGNIVTVRNVRYSKYRSSDEYTTIYYDATFNLNEIRTIDLVIVPFHALPTLAHVQASFGFADGRHIALSIEARYEVGEQYDPVAASIRQFELIYVLADERDLIRIGTDVNNNDVHIYRLKFEPSEVREMFVDALNRANSLSKKPEFYHPLRNSCVTNLMTHINKGRPKAIPREYRTLLPGLMDQYVYDLNLVDTTATSFKEAKANAKVNWLVEKYGDLEYFSAGIRQNMY